MPLECQVVGREVLVCGLADLVPLDPSRDMWVHDEGLYTDEANPVAKVVRVPGFTAQPYFGPVVIAGGVEGRGATQGLTESLGSQLLQVAKQSLADAG
jgi:hypothetical protein